LLFQSKHNSTIAGVRDLEKFFDRLEKRAKEFEKGSLEYLRQLSKNSSEIRNKILRYIMIRRTRNEISKYYSDDLQKNGVTCFRSLERLSLLLMTLTPILREFLRRRSA